eukprot:CAMPEP_0172602582 /NCGR_PEP_ID=MMETSP1068-20121228/22765_1 /TAXON_ID=35684 /ORGANISM="Pseudopedinella elastica, Strain CCMP716" /LENGTH=77 /DNA_ID=CAMNT_0013403993 /DNA_START=35 /DNA_END=266 /DNA_ORIENTATION=+
MSDGVSRLARLLCPLAVPGISPRLVALSLGVWAATCVPAELHSWVLVSQTLAPVFGSNGCAEGVGDSVGDPVGDAQK